MFRINKLTFKETGNNIYSVRNQKNEFLGNIDFYEPWGKFVFSPYVGGCVFDVDCMYEIVKKLRELAK